MAKYIDQDKLIEFANNHIAGIDANDIARFPTADVQEVKHGKWREVCFGNGITVPFRKYYICDQCNHTSQKKTRYCAYCGAKMDAKENDK